VLRLVKHVIDTAGAYGKPVTMCGELAGESVLARILLGLGARRFSVSRSHYQRALAEFQRLDSTREKQLADRLLRVDTGREVHRLLTEASDLG
jgi:phosphotransferase system enzyme I (PtsI)